MRFAITSLLLTVASLLACSPAPIPSTSGLASVVIPQTAVKDQGSVGFCWAYALMAFIENETLRTTGKTIDLSEEYLGLIRISAELAQDVRSGMPLSDIKAKIQNGELEGWFSLLPDKWRSEATDGFALIDKFGVLTEAEFSVKFQSPAAAFPFEPTPLMASGGYKNALMKIVETLDKDTTDIEFMQAVAESFGKELPAGGGHKIALKSKDYEALWAEKAEDAPVILQRIKETLADGMSVIFGYGVTFSKLSRANGYKWEGGEGKDLATYTKMSKSEARRGYARDGGHAVILTDFVNEGGREGRISNSALDAAVFAPWSDLDYVVFRNSWGLDTGLPPGMYRVDTEYMLGAAAAGVLDAVFKRK